MEFAWWKDGAEDVEGVDMMMVEIMAHGVERSGGKMRDQ